MIPDPVALRVVEEHVSFRNNRSRIFLPFDQQIISYVETELGPRGAEAALAVFLRWCEKEYDSSAYDDIQRQHLQPVVLEGMVNLGVPSLYEKYLDFPFWCRSKFQKGGVLGLKEMEKVSVLDLGSGPGHFGVVVKYFGHQYTGIDVPYGFFLPGFDRNIFQDLSRFFQIPVLSQKIRRFVPLAVPARYGLVTCLMGTFCVDENGRPWGREEWAFLLRDLVENVTLPEFRLSFQMSRNYIVDVWPFLRDLARSSDERTCTFDFDTSLLNRLT